MSVFTGSIVTDSALSRRNPTLKLALLTVVSLVAIFILDPITPTVLYLLALIAVAASVGAPLRTLAVAHVPFLAFALGVFIVNVLSRPGTILWQGGPVRITEEGLSIGAALAARTLLIGVLAIGFLLSTDGVALMMSLNQDARLSPRVTFAILAGYRMLQEMPREWATIRHAHSIRVDQREGMRPLRGPRHLAGVIFTLLVVTIRKGERMAQALESRGLGLQPRTTWRPIKITRTDWTFITSVLLVVAAVIRGSAALGLLEGPSALFG